MVFRKQLHFIKQNSLRAAHMSLLLAGLFVVASGLAACSLFRQTVSEATPTPLTAQVTADQIAIAMQEDHFFSDYRSETLFVQGTIASVSQQGGSTTVVLSTSVATAVWCDLGAQTTALHAGDAVTVSAPSAAAQRANNAVLLKNCTIPH